MEKSRRNLLTFSLFIIGLAVITVVEIAAELYLGGFNRVEIPEGAPDNILEITKNFILIFSIVMLLPQLYVGIKGVRVARNPDSSKGHIFWGSVIFILAVLGCVSSIIDWTNNGNPSECFSSLMECAFDAIIYCEFLVAARQVKNGC